MLGLAGLAGLPAEMEEPAPAGMLGLNWAGECMGATLVLAGVPALAGILISIVAGTPVGSTIVAADIGAFLVFCLIAKVRSHYSGR